MTQAKVKRLRTAHDFKLGLSDKEDHRFSKSQTVPDQSFSIQELLDKYARGVDVGVARNPVYPEQDSGFDDVDLEKVGQYDMFDKEQLLVQAKRDQVEAKRKLAEGEAAKAAAAKKAVEDVENERQRSEERSEAKREAKPAEKSRKYVDRRPKGSSLPGEDEA